MTAFEALIAACGYDCVVDENDDYDICLTFDDGRTQLVTLRQQEAPRKQVAGLFHIFSRACENVANLKESLLRSCLANSSKHQIGAWELRGEQLFFCVKLMGLPKATDLKRLINYVGVAADEFEKKYLGTDTE